MKDDSVREEAGGSDASYWPCPYWHLNFEPPTTKKPASINRDGL